MPNLNNKINNGPEDIFAGLDKNRVITEPVAPRVNSDVRLKQMLAQTENNSSPENFRLGIILMVLLVVVLVIIIGVYLFRNNQPNNSLGLNVINKISNITKSNNQTLAPKGQDTDHDGLSDEEEIKTYKTDPNKADTDNDGLTDREEVKVYKTDPNKADTDGDGVNDGQEIKNHRDPLNANPQAVWPPKK